MRLHAYVLAADPAFLAQSVQSYYDVVDRIVVREGLETRLAAAALEGRAP